MAVAVEADPVTGPGTVEFFNTDGDALGSLPAGALPDMLTFVYGDRYLLVANEGEADGEPIVDPNGRRDRNRAGKNFVEIQGPHRVARRRAALRRSAHRLRGVDSPTPSRLTRTAVSLTTSRPTRATPAIATAAKRRRGRVNSRWIQLRSPTMRATTRSSAA